MSADSAVPGKSPRYKMEQSVTTCMVRDVLIMDKTTPTSEAAENLQGHARDEIIVTHKDVVVGIVTDKDILDKVGDTTVYAETTKLENIMTKEPFVISEKKKLREALTMMHKTKHAKLPVVDGHGKALGIVYEDDILKRAQSAISSIPRLLSPPGKAVLGNLGFVMQFAGILLLLPALVATFMGDPITATGIYLTMVLLLVTGFFLNSYGEKARMNLRQASIVIFASLFLLSLFGTIPYLYIPALTPEGGDFTETFASAFFSSAAGFTTGGISLYQTPEDLPQSFTFYRSYTQMVGGMSFIYLVLTAFYPSRELETMRGFISGRELHLRELFGTITVIFALYVAVVAAALYLLGDNDVLDDISLAMSTLATGGFVPDSGILKDMTWSKQAVLMVAMVLGAMPFMFHHALVSKKFRKATLGKEVLVYFAILAAAILLFVWLGGTSTTEGIFYPVSASTTAGLQPTTLETLNVPGQYILMILMFIGGCGFSTAGGIKVFRLFHLSDAARMPLSGRLANALRIPQRWRSGRVGADARRNAKSTLIIVAAFPALSVLCGAYLVEFEGASPDTAYFDAVGVITTGGLSAGTVDFDTSPHTKVILSMMMIFGRLEIIAIVYALAPHILDRN